MFAVFKKELKAYFTSFFAYLYYGIFFLVVGLLFVVNCLSTYSTQFGYYVLGPAFLVVAAMIPFCTMRLFAQERKTRTDQLIFTAPVSVFSILVGKYLATVLFVLLPVLVSGIYPLFVSAHGEMSIRFLMGAYLAVILTSFVFLSVGMFISAVSSNMVISAVASYAVYAVIFLGRVIENVVSAEGIKEWIHNISVYNKYNDMVSGIVRSGDVIYLFLLAVVFFILTYLILEGRFKRNKIFFAKAGIVTVCFLLFSTLSLHYTKVWDFTAERLLSFSDETKEIVDCVEKPTEIYYIGEKSRANATYVEFFNAYSRMNQNISVQYINVDYNAAFKEQYLSSIAKINEASILVVCGEKYIYLDSADFISTIWTSDYSYKSMLEIENQLSSAIHYTNSETSNEVRVISGHGEEVLNSKFRNTLMVNNYVLKDLNLSEAMLSFKETFSEECKAVLINAPQTDYSEEEIEVLKQYLSEGGRLFVSLDPLNESLVRLYAFLKEYGFDIQNGIVVEADKTHYVYDTPYYLLPDMKESDLTDSLLKDKLYVLAMTSKGIKTDGEKNGYKVTELLTTSANAYSKVENFDKLSTKSENDIMGPFSVAAFSENTDKGAIMLLTSNVFFNEEVATNSAGANQKFFLNVMNTLSGNETEIRIEGKDISSQAALYPNTLQTFLKILAIIIIPAVILILGSLILIMRYKNISLMSLIKGEENEFDE